MSVNQDFSVQLVRMKSSFTEGFTEVMGGRTLKTNLVKYGCKSKSQKVKVASMKTFAAIAQAHGKTDDYLEEILPFIEATSDEQNNDLIFNCLEILKQAFKNTEPEKVSVTAQNQSQRISAYLKTLM